MTSVDENVYTLFPRNVRSAVRSANEAVEGVFSLESAVLNAVSKSGGYALELQPSEPAKVTVPVAVPGPPAPIPVIEVVAPTLPVTTEVPVFEIVPPSIVKALAVPRFTVKIGPATAGTPAATAIPSQINLIR